MKPLRIAAPVFICALAAAAQSVTIHVDAMRTSGPVRPIWAFFGHDEPNYTYMKDGKKLLTELSALNQVPVYVRVHNLLTTGDGKPALKWGSTNAYTEDANGKAVYDWTLTDRIFDTYVERKMKPLVEIGFMPQALSTHPDPYRHQWSPGGDAELFTGWAYPPKDYAKWGELVYQWVRHCVAKYGTAEVESWLWEVWNEPNIGYWKGTPEEYFRLYDFAADGVRRALPSARIGGPNSTSPSNERAAQFLRDFLVHATRGTNYATGKPGSPLDFVAFHAKGSPKFTGGKVVMGIESQLRDLDKGFEIVSSMAETKNLPVIIGESDPEGCAACSSHVYPQYAYRNGMMYAAYTAAVMPRHLDLAARRGIKLMGAVTWAFEFEDQPYFDGFRDLATNGIDKPVLNVFRMLGMMRGDRLAVDAPSAIPLDDMLTRGVKDQPDIHTMAVSGEDSMTILVSNYHDSSAYAPPAMIHLTITGLPARRRWMEHFRVDQDHSNAFESWARMGSPQPPSPAQIAKLTADAQLQTALAPRWVSPQKGRLDIEFVLPRHGVSLIRLTR